MKKLVVTALLIGGLLTGCESEDQTPTSTPFPPTLEPTAQAQAIQTSISYQFTQTANAQLIYAPTQTVDTAIRQTASAVYQATGTAFGAATIDANRAQTSVYNNLTLTAMDPTIVQRTVDAAIRQRFTATAQYQFQIDLNRTVDAAVMMTATAQYEETEEGEQP